MEKAAAAALDAGVTFHHNFWDFCCWDQHFNFLGALAELGASAGVPVAVNLHLVGYPMGI